MRRLLNTLYVTSQGAYLAKDGETVSVRLERETKLRVPVHTLDGIVCFGIVGCSPQLMGLCCERGVTVSFLSEHGRYFGRVQGSVSGNVLLRREQYRRADDEEHAADIARAVVIGKIANSRSVLMRAAREHASEDCTQALSRAARHLAGLLSNLKKPAPLDTVRGWEGDAAHVYFGVFNCLIVAQNEDFMFTRRSRRPPLDSINALLSFLYSLLLHDVVSACESCGLDPAVGYLHKDRPGRLGLALDLMEELRPILADRVALSLVNRQQVRAKGFIAGEGGAITMDESTRREVLLAYHSRKQDELQHPFLNEKLPVGLLPHVQSQLLARSLRGDLDAYPAFHWR